MGLVAGVVVLLVCLLALAAEWVAPRDPIEQNLEERFAPIGKSGYILGSDAFGRDILSRLIWGGRVSLVTGLLAAMIALGIGVPVGMVAGYRGGRLDFVIMRLVDMLLAFPYILLAIVIVGALGPGLRNTIVAVSVTSIPWFVRVIRGIVLTVRHQQFVEATIAVGASDFRVLRKAILPSVVPYVILSFLMSIGWLILQGAGLSFLGLGAQPPTPEWGAMLAESRQYLSIAPHVVILPGLMLFVVAAGLNLFGDALRDAYDITLN